MTLSRSTPLRANRDHGPPVDLPTMQLPVCSRCHRPYRWDQDTGRRTREPYGPCTGLSQTASLSRARKPLKRRTRLSPVSKTNSGREHQRDEAYREWIREQPCIVCGGPPPNDPHHVRSRGSGHGDWVETSEGKVGNLVPMDRRCHRELHAHGVQSFREKHDIYLPAEAAQLGRRYRDG